MEHAFNFKINVYDLWLGTSLNIQKLAKLSEINQNLRLINI